MKKIIIWFLITFGLISSFGATFAAQDLISSSQPNRGKQNLSNDQNLPPTIKPSNLNQITVGNDNSVQIINSFE